MFSFPNWTESIVYIIIAPWAIPVKRVFVPCFFPPWFPELVCTHQGFRSYTWSAQADSNWSSHIWQKILLTIVALLLSLLASFTICSFVLTKSNRIHSCNWLIGLNVIHFLSHICFEKVFVNYQGEEATFRSTSKTIVTLCLCICSNQLSYACWLRLVMQIWKAFQFQDGSPQWL